MRFLYLLLLLIYLAFGQLLSQQPIWQLASGTESVHVNDIAIAPGNPDIIYVIETEDFLFSTDRGESWQVIPGAPEGGASASIKVDPLDPQRIYASHYYSFQGSNGVSVSSDGGFNWSLKFYGTFFQAAIVETDPKDPNVIYAGQGPYAIRKSTDRGNSWALLPDTTMIGPFDLAIAPSNPQVLYIGSLAGIFKSYDGGYHWEKLSLGGSQVSWPRLEVDPYDEDIIYASAFDWGNDDPPGIYKSYDGGNTWQAINNGLSNRDRDIYTIEITPANPQELFIGTGYMKVLFRTTNGGENWENVSNGLPEIGHTESIAIDTANNRVYLGYSNGIYTYDYPVSIPSELPAEIPAAFTLASNFPNPFNSTTIIPFTLFRGAEVSITIYDITGQQIASLFRGQKPAGTHQVVWDAGELPGGIYLYRVAAGSKAQTRKALLMK